MSIRPKLLLIVTLGIAPLAALSVINYFNGLKVVEAHLRADLERDAQAIARDVESRLSEREEALTSLSRSPLLRDYLRNRDQPSIPEGLPKELQAEVTAALENNRKYYVAIACVGVDKRPLFRAVLNFKATPRVLLQTQDFLLNDFEPDGRVLTIPEQTLLRSPLKRESYGPALRYTLPVFIGEESPSARGALIVDLRLDALLDDASSVADSSSKSAPTAPSLPRVALILDGSGNLVYHTNDALRYRPVNAAMPPSFAAISDAMKEWQSGSRYFDSTEGDRWLVAYEPIHTLKLSVGIAANHTAAVRALRWMGWLSIGLTILLGFVVAILLILTLRRTTRSIQRVTDGAVAIAGGNLDEHIEVRSSDETRLLAETFNAMTDRLREQIAREAESRQFESFVRLSAILTHDLKNSILALSLLVSNMEQQFDDAEFRADAMSSLTEATDKLRMLVAKLSEPVRSLSGEFKRPRPVDLIPIINRVVARMADPSTSLHEVELRMPDALVAIADDERIERVIENLVLNALEAMDKKKGKLTIEAGPAEGEFVYFSVADTGPGMTKTFQRTNLFRPFATTKTKGVGLGLYTCRELIRALGGRIEIESERDSGTCFRVVLPSGPIAGTV